MKQRMKKTLNFRREAKEIKSTHRWLEMCLN